MSVRTVGLGKYNVLAPFRRRIVVYNIHRVPECLSHRDTYVEQQETEEIETVVKDVDRIQITKVYASCPGGGLLGGHKSPPIRHKHMLSPPAFIFPLVNEDLPAGPQLCLPFDNWFSRHHACYSLLLARPGYKSCQAKRLGMVVSGLSLRRNWGATLACG
jgi:hypothetical protein